MEVNHLPQLSTIYSNNSNEFLNEVFNICHHKINVINHDVVNWRILINFYRFFVSWFVPVLIMFGEIGTMICLIVLLRRRTSNAETRMWFVALSISDMYSLAVGLTMLYSSKVHFIFPGLMENRSDNHWDMRHNSVFNCYLLNGMVYFGLLVSTWIQVGISVLRVLSVKAKTMRHNSVQHRKFGIALGACILFTLLITFLLVGFSIEYHYPTVCPLYKICVLRSGVNQYFFYVSLVIKVLLPSIILLCCSVMIINHLKRFKRRFATKNGEVNSPLHSAIRKRVKQTHISYILLGMNFTFFILTLPFEVFKIYFFYNIPRSNDPNFSLIRVIDKLLNILLYTNNATNWLFYFMLGKRFRQNMRKFLCQRYVINCGSLVSSIRRFSTSIRTTRRTRTTPIIETTNKRINNIKRSTSPDKERCGLVVKKPEVHCS